MATKIGKDCKVTLGSNTIVGIGTWSMDGITTEQLDDSAFGDNWKKYKFGMKDGGNVTFSGLYDPADVTGQDVIKAANLDNTEITTLRLYVDNTSYYEPCRSTGWWTPTDSTGNDTKMSYLNVTSYNVSSDKSGLMQTSFTLKVSGCMVLV